MCPETNFKDIWNRQPTATAPAASEIISKANQLKRKINNKTLFSILLLTATMVLILLIVYYAKPQMPTTIIGTALVCAAILLFIFVSGSLVHFLFTHNEENRTIKQQLTQLLQLRTRQAFIQKKILTLYFILLSAGIFLYMIEYTLRMSTSGKIAAYGITAGWFALNWFYFRPRTIRKQQARLNEVIDQLQKINQQLEPE
ncbi:hypothetical protein CLV51_104342 [Chitinophaga niastensis]|uniref:Uncharacterized protein n=1 Tax=Chitinophaga niastensis TaxID=536980 RepID=A0A2P8HHF5_CHINA|nr:hypothetical protein [Chitinophaga niastensis]PSL45636.1 hypothetical protein CLV51_104342 [Chitinophaga niastensis]